MEVLLGGISSLLYGVADFLGGEGTKKVSAATIVFWSGSISLPLMAITALLVGGDASLADYGFGFAAGVSGVIGLISLFTGLARGSAAVVAPLSAAVGAMVPVAVAVLLGDRPAMLAWIGVAVAIPAIALSAWTTDREGSPRSGLLFGALAGAGFGGFAAIIRFTDDSSGLLPLVAARAGTFGAVALIGLMGIWKINSLKSTPRLLVVGNSLLDVSANVTLLLALRAGEFALAAVAGSAYPAVTVLMAMWVNGEHVRVRQLVGIGLTLLALGMIALS